MRWRALPALLLFAAAAHAGTYVPPADDDGPGGGGGVTSSAPPAFPELRVADLGDIQNYVSVGADGPLTAEFQAFALTLLDKIVDDVIAWRPDFALLNGDLTDSTGGVDQNGLERPQDDPDSLTCTTLPMPTPCAKSDEELEWQRARTRAYDRLIAAGIPVIVTGGNHDSLRDFERWFPPAEFLGYSWASSVHTIAAVGSPDPTSCNSDYARTSQRVSLISTRVGPVCAIGEEFTCADTAWLKTVTGCGGPGIGYPTFLFNHGQSHAGLLTTATLGQLKPIVATGRGHFVDPNPGAIMLSQGNVTFSGGTGRQYKEIAFNTQELTDGAGGTGTNHTGGGWWAKITVSPHANTITVQAQNPYLQTQDSDSTRYSFQNTTQSLPNNWCTDFAGQGC